MRRTDVRRSAPPPASTYRGDMTRPGYLDAVSGRPMSRAAREALLAALDDGWADPRRLHAEGRRAGLLLDAAREAVAAVLQVRADEVSFAGSGAQAVHLAVAGTLFGRRRTGATVVLSAVEHSSVLAAAQHSAPTAAQVIGVDPLGRVDLDAFAAGVAAPGVALACLQAANAEVGTCQPVREAAEACDAAGVPLLVDASHALGHIAVAPVWGLLSAGARGWGGPPGVAVLGIRRSVRWRSAGPDDDAESGRVPGDVALPDALAAAAGLEAAVSAAATDGPRLHALVERVRTGVEAAVPDVDVVGDPVDRLPHVVTFSCLYVDGEALVTELDRAGFAVGSGSACTSSTLRPSHVLAAMGVLTHGNVRVSLLPGTTDDTVEAFLRVLPRVVTELRGRTGAGGL